jgi:fructoselysine-6-P-deglycase FrlB-like protein
MTEMIAAEPAVAERIVHRLLADHGLTDAAEAIRAVAARGESIVTTGCGTSEHAAMGVAAFLADALRRPAGLPTERVGSVQAFEYAARPTKGGVLVAVSHEGGTWATNLALEAARGSGVRTILITVGPGSPGAALADHLLLTGEQDQSWCHTVGYLSPLIAGAVLSETLRRETIDPTAVRALLDAADPVPAAEASATALGECSRLLVVGTGIDHATVRELALKVEEGAHLPTTAHQLETIRHGHLAAADERTGLVLVLTDGEARGAVVVERATAMLRSAAALQMPAAAIVAADLGDDLPRQLTPAGRATVPLTSHLPRVVAAALGAVIPMQLFAERLARTHGVNQDTLGREDPRQAAAADA